MNTEKEGVDFVTCRICGTTGGTLCRHIFKHGITAVEYAAKFPNAKLVCDAVRDSRSSKLRAKPKKEARLVCQYCGAGFSKRQILWVHEKKEVESFINGKEGEDYVVCKICGLRAEGLNSHLWKVHHISVEKYCSEYNVQKTFIDRISDRLSEMGRARVKPIEDRASAKLCVKCGQWYLGFKSAQHLKDCVSAHPDKYVEGEDYVKCPECGIALSRLGEHLKEAHGWDEDKIAIEVGRGLAMIASKITDRRNEGVDFAAIQKRREESMMKKYGVANPFELKDVQDKMKETSMKRYGVSHPMQNEEVFTRQTESAERGPSSQEVFFDEHTCKNVVYVGFGGRFIRTKTGVHKFGRLIKDLNPDFIVLSDNVLDSALEASKERRKLSSEKHRSKYVVELLGDYYHSEEMIGVKPEDHEREIIGAYKSAGIECLVLWEKDVMGRWNEIEPKVNEWIGKAVADMNANPIWSRATKSKKDARKATLGCPFGSGRKFKSQKMLDKWLVSPSNYWRDGMVEGVDYICCKECGERTQKVAEHIRKAHGMTKETYLEKHGADSPLVSSRLSELIGERNRGFVGCQYKRRVAYRRPDGVIIRRKDAWLRAWGNITPPADSIVDGSLYVKRVYVPVGERATIL